MTPFGRQPVTAGLLAAQAQAEAPAPLCAIDKWSVLRDLTVARKHYGVSDRDLVVLSALISFHPAQELQNDAPLIVFPSNASLSDRAHGMPESTLRRHLAALINAGLIMRRDSPNGKRYARRTRCGGYDRAFGFDLRPLLVQAQQIAQAAETVRDEAWQLRRKREEVTIRLRDLRKLMHWQVESSIDVGEQLATLVELQKCLRRKLDLTTLTELNDRLKQLEAALPLPSQTEHMSGADAQNERHYHNSNKDISESEQVPEEQKSGNESTIPLEVVLKAAPDIEDYAPHPIQTWHQLHQIAEFVRPMLGIPEQVWRAACLHMGPGAAATVLACILQRGPAIAKPGAYLRKLISLSEDSNFAPHPMVMALLRQNTNAVH